MEEEVGKKKRHIHTHNTLCFPHLVGAIDFNTYLVVSANAAVPIH